MGQNLGCLTNFLVREGGLCLCSRGFNRRVTHRTAKEGASGLMIFYKLVSFILTHPTANDLCSITPNQTAKIPHLPPLQQPTQTHH